MHHEKSDVQLKFSLPDSTKALPSSSGYLENCEKVSYHCFDVFAGIVE